MANWALALETSGRVGSVTLGRGDELVATAQAPPAGRMDLMPTIDALCRRHRVTPRDIGEVYVSIGPGSFTGLRVGIATAKMLGRVLGARLVAVPSLNVVAQNAPPPPEVGHLAVGLNLKKDTIYAGVFAFDGQRWRPEGEPSLGTIGDLLARAPRPLAILADPLPPLPDKLDSNVRVLPAELAVARSEAVYRLGHELARAQRFTPELELLPLYVRPPEAIELWERNRRK